MAARIQGIEDPSCARMMLSGILQGLDRKGTSCTAIFLHYSKSSETSGGNIHCKKGSKRLKMLYPFTHWPAEALDVLGDSMQGNKVPAGHSHLIRVACLGPSGCCCRPRPFCIGRRSAHPISSSGPATQPTLARTRCQSIPATLSIAAGGEFCGTVLRST